MMSSPMDQERLSAHCLTYLWMAVMILCPTLGQAMQRHQTIYSLIMDSASIQMPQTTTRSMGNGFATHNNIYTRPNAGFSPVAAAETSMIITVPASPETNSLETRLFHMVVHYPNGRDSIVVDGLSIALVPDAWMPMQTPSYRAITGGTGKFKGASGQAKFTRISPEFVKIELDYAN
ncbi:MAG: hypothetical protein RLZ25_700 [Pseudomonadota bacterium]